MKQVLEKNYSKWGNFERTGIVFVRAAELARGVNVILDKEFTKKARSIYRGLEANGYYNIRGTES